MRVLRILSLVMWTVNLTLYSHLLAEKFSYVSLAMCVASVAAMISASLSLT